MFHAFGVHSLSTGTNPNTTKANLIRLTELHFISQITSTNNKARAQIKCVCCKKRGFCKDAHFCCATCHAVLCFNESFEVYHTKRNIKKSLHEDPCDPE